MYAFLTEHPTTSWQQHSSLFSPSFFFYCWSLLSFRTNPFLTPKHICRLRLIKYTPCPHKYNGQKHSSRVPLVHVHVQRHTSEINSPLGGVAATQRAVIIKSFGMVKVQCTHTVEAAGQHSGRNKWCGSGYFWNELNEMQSRLWIMFSQTCFTQSAGMNTQFVLGC